MTLPIVLFSIGLAFYRIAGHKAESFQALSHIWVTYLFCAAYSEKSATCLWCGLGLSAVELATFMSGFIGWGCALAIVVAISVVAAVCWLLYVYYRFGQL